VLWPGYVNLKSELQATIGYVPLFDCLREVEFVALES